MYYEYLGLKKPPFDNVPDPTMYVESHIFHRISTKVKFTQPNIHELPDRGKKKAPDFRIQFAIAICAFT